jgi:hypothetical protein
MGNPQREDAINNCWVNSRDYQFQCLDKLISFIYLRIILIIYLESVLLLVYTTKSEDKLWTIYRATIQLVRKTFCFWKKFSTAHLKFVLPLQAPDKQNTYLLNFELSVLIFESDRLAVWLLTTVRTHSTLVWWDHSDRHLPLMC